MNELDIRTYKSIEQVTNITGIYKSPVYFRIEISNNTNNLLKIDNVILTVLRLGGLWHKNIKLTQNVSIMAKQTFCYEVMTEQLLLKHNLKLKGNFKIVVNANNKAYKSPKGNLKEYSYFISSQPL